MCRLLSFAGLLDRRLLETGLGERSSRSELYVAWTNGLVGGRNVNFESEDWLGNRGLRWGRRSDALAARKGGKLLCHGATGDVANTAASLSFSLRKLASSLKSPECRADLGRSISIPAASFDHPSPDPVEDFGDS